MKKVDELFNSLKELKEFNFKEVESEHEQEVFGKNARFDVVMKRILSKIETRSKAKQAELYRNLMDQFIEATLGSPQVDRKLLKAAQLFYRNGFLNTHKED